MKIVIKKKAFVPGEKPAKGRCPECAKWTQENTPPDKLKRDLGRCTYHGCFTPKDGSCNAFVVRK